jgi:putative transcriptional regulator
MWPSPLTVCTVNMAMRPPEIKAELVRRERTMSEIARRLEVTPSHVAQVVAGKRRSPTVERAVADAIGKPVSKVFSSAA